MCRKLVVTNEIFLGTRAICYEAYSLPKGEVVELTEKQIKDALKGITTDEVYGLELSEAGELVMDKKTLFHHQHDEENPHQHFNSYGRGGLFSQPFLYCDRYT